MTGKELIIYILQNNLENVDLIEAGLIQGWMSIGEFAMKHKVGPSTVFAWEQLGSIKLIRVGDMYYVSELKGVHNNG